jgi:hypothetical protein
MAEPLHLLERAFSAVREGRLLSAVARRTIFPDTIWGTKGFEFWTFLSLLLLSSRCQRILELGSGRSTITFAEYAKHRGAHFTSLETSRKWYNKGKFELQFINLPTSSLKLIELDRSTGWYRLDQFRSLIRPIEPIDCILIDAPNRKNGDSAGVRDASIALETLRACCAGADVVLIDDAHRRHVFATIAPTLAEPEKYETYFFDYRVGISNVNWLCICIRKNSKAAGALPEIQRTLNLDLSKSRSADQCPDP